MKHLRYPIPVETHVAPYLWPRSTTRLALAIAFATGVAVTAWGIALFIIK